MGLKKSWWVRGYSCVASYPSDLRCIYGEQVNLVIVSARHFCISPSDTCPYCKSLWIKASAKCKRERLVRERARSKKQERVESKLANEELKSDGDQGHKGTRSRVMY